MYTLTMQKKIRYTESDSNSKMLNITSLLLQWPHFGRWPFSSASHLLQCHWPKGLVRVTYFDKPLHTFRDANVKPYPFFITHSTNKEKYILVNGSFIPVHFYLQNSDRISALIKERLTSSCVVPCQSLFAITVIYTPLVSLKNKVKKVILMNIFQGARSEQKSFKVTFHIEPCYSFIKQTKQPCVIYVMACDFCLARSHVYNSSVSHMAWVSTQCRRQVSTLPAVDRMWVRKKSVG